ncbi:tetratricopeptide repeat protein [Rhizobium sp. BK376]|jgi:tetratricopeptide (TPR) repeat protein/glutathione synthase/RimK-type ligase-like ATP-grasp enzyme|uniref:tetratricopeptide repeat protein n=1 Tax=Rhizobium sp. BK376 TaxID=2512149 RepID=UPI001045D30D|nr:tetratricopeptide repeat protein [Rhizobium sp. BK376]TCR91142.1 tetratricopeptide repeat protein [Rhizobium sp. BK376]
MNQSPAASSFDASALLSVLTQVSNLMGAGDNDGAIALLLSSDHLVRRAPVACNMLAFLLLQADRPQEAVAWFDASLAIKPEDAQVVAGLGMAYQTVGDLGRALECYDKAIALRPEDAGHWYHHGVVLADLGRSDEALSSLDRAVALKDDYNLAWARRSRLLMSAGNLAEAVASAARCCRLAPGEVSSWVLLGDALQTDDNLQQAIAAYDRGLSLAPTDFYCLCNKAQALKKAGLTEPALACAQNALRADPTNREALLLCGNLEYELGNEQAARICFRSLASMGAVRSYPAAHQPARLRALMLFSPMAGNTPYEDLIKGASFDADVAIVLPDYRYDPGVLGHKAHVVVNLVSETDFGLDVIASVADLISTLQKPVINHPGLISGTDRQSISQRLAGISGAVMPTTVRMDGADLRHLLSESEIQGFPLIVRHAGTHGGEKMELVSDPAALLSFAEEAGDRALYLTDFVDYSSPDGFFRKYRLIFVGEEILPYHLAIGDVWKVHHASTRMAEAEWMRNEEQAFLDNPGRVFGPEAMATLDAIRREIGLDYFGIDCSVDSDGRIVIFEVNASMLIHLHNEGFDYKTPHVMRIKAAFERLLERRSNEA